MIRLESVLWCFRVVGCLFRVLVILKFFGLIGRDVRVVGIVLIIGMGVVVFGLMVSESIVVDDKLIIVLIVNRLCFCDV